MAFHGCEWPIDSACFDEEWEALDEDVKERSLALAGQTLRRLTAYRVGGCPIVVRPSPQHGACFVPVQGSFPVGLNSMGRWVNNCGACGTGCEVALPAPVGRVDEVKVDGVVIAQENYQIQNGNLLVWMGGGDCPFPPTQDMSLPDTEVGTFSVTMMNSYPVDDHGAYAAGVLAMEFAKACIGNKKCRLPGGTRNVTRAGVSFEIIAGSFPDGWTGISEVDTFIGVWNPRNRIQPTGVWSPGNDTRIVTGGGA